MKRLSVGVPEDRSPAGAVGALEWGAVTPVPAVSLSCVPAGEKLAVSPGRAPALRPSAMFCTYGPVARCSGSGCHWTFAALWTRL